ncbi:MAG: iron-containing redox enzyme family protein [Gemmatimonadetes bacterium]|nr:iron-containing redox enzyme family protein [Gemmatimonadota bacterium]
MNSLLEATDFLDELEREIALHPAVRHPFLQRFSRERLTLPQIQTYGLQHYQLVRVFLTYMTNLVARMPGSWAGTVLRSVFEDEFGQYTLFRSHVHLYQNFLRALGLHDEEWGRVEWLEETRNFIDGHLKLTQDGDVLMALGAIGPGHEYSIPLMFDSLLKGLRHSTALTERDLEYFVMHIEEDRDHAVAFRRLIAPAAGTQTEKDRVRRGALFSLELRRHFWSGCHAAVFGGTP